MESLLSQWETRDRRSRRLVLVVERERGYFWQGFGVGNVKSVTYEASGGVGSVRAVTDVAVLGSGRGVWAAEEGIPVKTGSEVPRCCGSGGSGVAWGPMSNRDAWEALYHRFDPKVPAVQMKWRSERPLSPTAAVSKALDRPFGIPRVLMTGTTGTGKTTELLHIAEGRARKEFVVFLDLVS